MFKKIFLTAAVIFSLATPVFVLAATAPCTTGLNCALGNLNAAADTSKTGLSSDLGTTVATVIKTVLALVGTIFLVLTIYAGIMWMTAQGAEDRVEKAKEIIKASVIGLVIIMSAYAITYFVTSRLAAATTTQSGGGSDYTAICNQATSDVSCINVQDTNGQSICSWYVPGPGEQGVCKPL